MKRKINLLLLISIIVSIMTIFIPSKVYACSCVQPLSVKEELGRSDAVFTGRVLEIKEETGLQGFVTKSVLFEITQIWKGESKSQMIIHTGAGGGDCGYHFEESKDYLVYASLSTMYGNKEQLVTIICDRTKGLADAQEDLTKLGEGKVPTEQVNLENELNRIQPYPWVTMLGIVVIGVMIFFIWRKVKK
ncbi:hypothetical protein [Paenibacillus sp. Marseille-Q4541]|uniref:hypothetical protein n=1 Tax=Paenibacillus sp. Marseille-Q4541 TaxID=2831522 RepID=UPI001BA45A07|nr:hypothetical protein [Paenibacillus sp. Marseille-Q4541]